MLPFGIVARRPAEPQTGDGDDGFQALAPARREGGNRSCCQGKAFQGPRGSPGGGVASSPGCGRCRGGWRTCVCPGGHGGESPLPRTPPQSGRSDFMPEAGMTLLCSVREMEAQKLS